MLADLIKNNRSYRRFYQNEEISHQTLINFINNTRFCPTARNQQVLVYRAVTEEKIRQVIFPFLNWAGYLKDWAGPPQGERPNGYIIIGVNNKRLLFKDEWLNADLGIACQTILLQAAEKNLGGCIIAAINKSEIKKALNISEDIELKVVIALGKPKLDVKIEEIDDEDDIKYYRNNGEHIVPKRKLDDILF
ncbi:MAG: nitroreductase family protein [Bacteroidales bacterium]|nr:nitroreductase family protein [Bacteroidales bacterium]